ncbi:MAG TPA: ABC transporter permease [Thermoleophilaceae bacterium]|nr:ABC transporter permease [Thermoleophilaceae bacterium]
MTDALADKVERRRAGIFGLPEVARRARATATAQRFLAVFLLVVAMFVYFSVTEDRFFTSGNIDALLTSASILWVVSIGLTFVMITGGFDLSLGSLVALTGIALGAFVNDLRLPIGVAVVLILLFGLALGAGVNGFLIGRVGLSFLVVTLGTLTLFQGLTNLWSGTKTQQVLSSFLDSLAFDKLLGIPIPVWIMVGVFLIALYVQRSTYFGRDMYAVGGSADAARLSGIKVSRTIIVVYGIAGLLAALGGVLQVARIGAASPVVGQTIIFNAAAAVLLGGTSFAGGIGGVGGTAVGVLFLATLQNGLSVSGVQDFWQQIITGAILIVAVTLDRIQREGWGSLGFGTRPGRSAAGGAAAEPKPPDPSGGARS